jgi:hypothetical protein
MKMIKQMKAQSTLEYICVCIVFASVGIGTLFIMANRAVALRTAERHGNSITSHSGNYAGTLTPPKVDTNNPPPATAVDGEPADDRVDPSHPGKWWDE